MADLDKFTKDLISEHDALTKAFEAAQVKAEAEWADYEQKKAAVSAWRAKYGKVYKALQDGAVKVEG